MAKDLSDESDHRDPGAGDDRAASGGAPDAAVDDEADPLAAMEREQARRRWRTMRRILLIPVLALLGALILLPQIASLPPVRERLVTCLNGRVAPRTIAVRGWSLNWWTPLTFRGVKVSDPAAGVQVAADDVTVSRGLLRLLPFGRLNLGEIDARQVGVRLVLPAPPPPTPPEVTPPPPPPPHPPPPPEKPAGPARLPLADLAFRLTVRDGRIAAVAPEGAETELLVPKAAVDMPSWNDRIGMDADLRLPSPAGEGSAAISLRVARPATLLAGGRPAVSAAAEARVASLDLAAVQAIAGRWMKEWRIEGGRLDGNVKAKADWPREVKAEIDLTAAGVRALPPGAADPTPAADVRLAVDMLYADGRLTVREGALRSPWVTASADGSYVPAPVGGVPSGSLRAQMRVELPEVARDFRRQIGLAQGVVVDRGRVSIALTAEADAAGRRLSASAVATNLFVRANGKPLSVTPPPSLDIRIWQPHGQNAEVEAFDLRSSFARLSGAGRVDRAAVAGYVDLTALTRDLGTVLPGLPAMVGRMDIEGRADRQGDRARASARLSAADVAVALPGNRRLALEKGRFAVGADIPLVDGRPGTSVERFEAAFTGAFGTLSAACARVAWPARSGSRTDWAVSGGAASADLDLAATARFLGPWLRLPPRATVAGRMRAGATCEAGAGIVKARYTAAVQEASLETTAWRIADRDARLSGALEAEPSARRWTLSGVEARAAASRLTVPRLSVKLPAGAGSPEFQGEASASANLTALAAWRKAAPGETLAAVRGRAEIKARAGTLPEGTAVDLAASFMDLTLDRPGSPPWVEPESSLSVDALLARREARVTFRRLTAESSFATVQAAGTLAGWPDKTRTDLSGTLAVDFSRIDRLFRAEGLRYPAVSGKQARPFAFRAPLSAGATSVFSYGAGHAACHLESLGAFGVAAGPADLNASLTQGVLRVNYGPPLGSGRARVLADVALTTKPMLLTVPAQTRVLDGVPLTTELLRDILGRINPLLRTCAASRGRIGLSVGELSLPLDRTATRSTDFRTRLELDQVAIEPAGVLAEVLALAGAQGESLQIEHEALDVVCRNGRVQPGVQRATVAGNPVLFSGSVGLDGTVAYRVEVPLSEKLVGREAWKYLKGQRVAVPVTGTIDRPAVDRQSLKSEIARLVAAAAAQVLSEQAGDLIERLREKVERRPD